MTANGLELRTISPSERDAVLDLLARWFDDREFFDRYVRHDPSFRDDLCFVATDRGTIVSTLQVFRRRVRLVGGIVEVAAVGNVFTAETHRGRGLATALLERALAAMPDHDFDMSLLFATRIPFYGRLGWRSHVRHLVFLEAAPPVDDDRYAIERFRPADLDAVARVYDLYTADRVGTTVRSPAYWQGQLRFAGNPTEDFLVARDGADVVAYARGIVLYGLYVVMEHACAPAHEPALASVIARLHSSVATGFAGTLTQLTGDDAVLANLRARGLAMRTIDDVFWLWRVIDVERVAAAGRIGPEQVLADDAMFHLLPPERSVYWIADRF
ncbi:GNAT family N-acetyltransferase [Candidatus Binatia bacterium]|nr:GNAT family N-acetyltransferase [Candidatus Binatia bacterium]